jgi:hypothetical protein
MIWLAIFGPSHYRKKQHARLASKQEPPPVPGWLILYFGVLITLTIVALIPSTITIGFLFLLFLVWCCLRRRRCFIIRSLCYRPTSSIDFFGRPLLASLIAIVGLASAALLPHYASKLERVVAAKPTLAAAYPTWPFYFGYVRCENSVNVCLAIARD